jgi:hypothetical protein
MEFVMFALQSRSPDHIGHTSVDINSLKTYQEAVGVGVNSDDELELVFAHDRDVGARSLRKVVLNKAYCATSNVLLPHRHFLYSRASLFSN